MSDSAPAISRNQSLAMLGASGVAALSAFAATVIAQRLLPASDVTEFLLFWSLLFGIYGVIGGIASESTRAVGAAQLTGPGGAGQRGARPTLVALAIGLAVALLVGISSPLWAPEVLTQNAVSAVASIAAATVLYAVQVAMTGTASGTHRWYLVAGINGGEALWRLAVMALVGLVAGSLWGLELAVVSPALLWVVLLALSADARAAFGARGDIGAGQLTRNILFAMGSAAASAVLTVGFPLMMSVTEDASPGSYEDLLLGGLVLAISITRSPIMIPLQAFQGVAIAHFLKQRHRPVKAMATPVAALLGVGLVGAVAAYLIGPWLFLEIYEPKPEQVEAYGAVAQGWVLGLLTFASAIMALLVLSGTAVLAMNLHRFYIAGWVVAAVFSLLLLCVPLELTTRVLISLFVGPAAGFATHMAGLVLKARADR